MNFDNEKYMLFEIQNSIDEYFKYGSKSNIRLNNLTKYIVKILEYYYPNYIIKTEFNIDSFNCSGFKKCDIVVLKDLKTPLIIFPLKFPISNYKQNRNNYWENLCGECFQMKIKNKNVKIIPINIIFNKIPYLSKDRKIQKFENIDYNDSFEIYNKFIYLNNNIIDDFINYIIDVKHYNQINEEYTNVKIIRFNEKTPFTKFRYKLPKIYKRQSFCEYFNNLCFKINQWIFLKI